MICKKCGEENADGKFCSKCGEPLEQAEVTSGGSMPEVTLPQQDDIISEESLTDAIPAFEAEESKSADEAEESKSAEVQAALGNLERYEEGTITHPDEKPRPKGSFFFPKNPMLWAFGWLLVFALVLGGLTTLFFSFDIGGTQIIFGVLFALFTAAVLVLDFMYYLPSAITLSRLFRGKGVRLEYKLKDHEILEQAEIAKKRNRGFYLAISLFGLAFTIYHIVILVNSEVPHFLMWVSIIYSLCIFVIFALMFFLMPKYNYQRMMQGGKRVIIGEKSVYYGGTYYHWRSTEPEATIGNVNSRKHELQLTFLQVFKNGKTHRRKVDVFLPDRELNNATNLTKAYEVSAKAYHEKQLQNSLLNENQESSDKKKK